MVGGWTKGEGGKHEAGGKGGREDTVERTREHEEKKGGGTRRTGGYKAGG